MARREPLVQPVHPDADPASPANQARLLGIAKKLSRRLEKQAEEEKRKHG